MSLLQIRPYFDPILRIPSEAVELDADGRCSPEVIKLAMNMVETSRAVNGAGMAAVQVGVPIRLFILDLEHRGGDTITFINPELMDESPDLVTQKEGCLSMPNKFIELARPAWAVLAYTNIHGQEAEYRAEGLAAMCVQHELDHLNGIRNIDRLSKLKRELVLKSYKKHKPYMTRTASSPGTAVNQNVPA